MSYGIKRNMTTPAVLTAVTVQMTVLCAVTSYSLVDIYRISDEPDINITRIGKSILIDSEDGRTGTE
jgi:hypothetical protein